MLFRSPCILSQWRHAINVKSRPASFWWRAPVRMRSHDPNANKAICLLTREHCSTQPKHYYCLLCFRSQQALQAGRGASGQWRGCAVLDYDNLIHYQTSGGFITEGKNYHVPGPATRAPSHDSTHQIPGCRIASHAASGRRMGPLCSNRTLDPCKACRIAYSAIETVSVI